MRIRLSFALVVLVLAGRGQTWAASPPIAHLVTYSGTVQVLRQGHLLPLSPDLPLLGDDVILTQQGRALVRFTDSTELRLGPHTRISPSDPHPNRSIRLFAGRLWAFVAKLSDPVDFRTGGTIAAVRGTEFALGYDEERTELDVFEGQVETAAAGVTLAVGHGQSAVVEPGQAPTFRVIARPRDAVQWALYYVPVIDLGQRQAEGDGAIQAALDEASGHCRRGDLGAAAAALEAVAETGAGDRRFLTYRAALRLGLGMVEGARADIAAALVLAPGDGEALALESVMAVVGNQTDAALELADKAVASDPGSVSPLIARSYAQQARFDLAGARASLEQAVKLKPANALAWARLAEVRSALGDLDGALQAANQATFHQPSLARTQTVLGFAYLTQVKPAEAVAALRKAIALDASDPLPRLGLGLAMIRQGHLAEGRAELEVAVGLDPNNALLRSYLGKAYFEEKRPQLDLREYDKAKELDPNDPTPWFYDAIAKQVLNRPVEALHDLQAAIERNDNRAVYRSRLLLDSDLAARGASLGRIYSDLGFQELALVEGWHSVNTDPSEYSAHRLLADSYAALPRHEIARVSELLQSQLLQPLSTTAIQPRLAESSLFLLSAQGPAALSFNEFNPLFNRDQITFQGSAVVGEDSTWSVDPLVAGIYKHASFSAGYSRFETDGYRENNRQEDEVGNVFGQVELSPKTSVQGEVRRRDLAQGDASLHFYEDDFSPLRDDRTKTTTARVGLRHGFGPGSTVLVSYVHQDRDGNSADAIPGQAAIDIDRQENAHSGETQYLFRSSDLHLFDGLVRSLNFTVGAGYFHIDSKETASVTIDLPPPPIGPGPIVQTSDLDKKIHHTNFYLYSNLGLPHRLTLTLGVSADLFDDNAGVGERAQANPKVGLTWNPWPRTTFRAAAFRALKRTLITDQTLEPTQVAGFNQFYDDASGTESWVYGGAIDHKFSDSVFAGAEFTRRDLDFPVTILASDGGVIFTRESADERDARVYLFATPSHLVALSAEYQNEHFGRDPLGGRFEKLTTHLVPLSLRLFHRQALSGLLRATHLRQDGQFLRGEQTVDGEQGFWVLDAAVRYRLPKRYGYLSFGVNNLTDERSTYEATDPHNLAIRPGRAAFGSLTLALP